MFSLVVMVDKLMNQQRYLSDLIELSGMTGDKIIRVGQFFDKIKV